MANPAGHTCIPWQGSNMRVKKMGVEVGPKHLVGEKQRQGQKTMKGNCATVCMKSQAQSSLFAVGEEPGRGSGKKWGLKATIARQTGRREIRSLHSAAQTKANNDLVVHADQPTVAI